MKLNGKVAIVTGAASGMGKDIALLYAQEGAKIVVSDINYEGAQVTVAEIEKNCGIAIAIKTDVTNQDDIENMFSAAIVAFGTVDILVNNAGIMDNMGAVGDISIEQWDRVIAVNATSVMRATKELLPIVIEKGSGVIVNIASVGGLRGSVAGAAYTASKHAVIGLTKNTGFQYAKLGIRCNAIAPGPINTNISATMTNLDEKGAALCHSGMGVIPRLGEGSEIANVALFLASDDASFVNGTVIAVDGGWTAY